MCKCGEFLHKCNFFVTNPFQQGAPMDISDMRDRMIDIEQNFKRSAREKEANNDRLNDVEKDLNQILGRDETGEATGTPSIVSFQLKQCLKGFAMLQCCSAEVLQC